jgi:hypothetical protein
MRNRLLLVLLIGGALPVLAEKFHLNPTATNPAAFGEVNIDRDGNGNTRIDLHVEHLAHPADLSPPMDSYVVWIQGAGLPPENLGELKVGGDLKAGLKTVTPLRDFDIVITAEHDPRATAMTGPVVMRSTIHQR